MTIFKGGVRIDFMLIEDVVLLALPLIDNVFREHAGREAIVTSVTGGRHREDSWHYKGRAVDLRSHDLTEEQKDLILADLRDTLGQHWDVILEDRNERNEHYHLEADWDD